MEYFHNLFRRRLHRKANISCSRIFSGEDNRIPAELYKILLCIDITIASFRWETKLLAFNICAQRVTNLHTLKPARKRKSQGFPYIARIQCLLRLEYSGERSLSVVLSA